MSEYTQEMYDWYIKRTNMHIKLVQKWAQVIVDQYWGESTKNIVEEFLNKLLLNKVKDHDKSKLEDESEIKPYVFISWMYKMKDQGIDYKIPDDVDDTAATTHHVLSNDHHPEYWSDNFNPINRVDRDKPKELIDATNMTDTAIVHMCCDWMAMSEEKGTDPMEWADKNINVRWKFDEDQVDLIKDILLMYKGEIK